METKCYHEKYISFLKIGEDSIAWGDGKAAGEAGEAGEPADWMGWNALALIPGRYGGYSQLSH